MNILCYHKIQIFALKSLLIYTFDLRQHGGNYLFIPKSQILPSSKVIELMIRNIVFLSNAHDSLLMYVDTDSICPRRETGLMHLMNNLSYCALKFKDTVEVSDLMSGQARRMVSSTILKSDQKLCQKLIASNHHYRGEVRLQRLTTHLSKELQLFSLR